MTYYQQRRVELLGDRCRKFYRDSRAVAQQMHSRRKADAMQSAVRRLSRVL